MRLLDRFNNPYFFEMKRQLQVANQIKEELASIFIKNSSAYFGGAFVTISEVSISPDLLETRVFISVLNADDLGKVMKSLERHKSDIRRKLGTALRHLRRIPSLHFLADTTQETAFRIDRILDDIKKEDDEKPFKGLNPDEYSDLED